MTDSKGNFEAEYDGGSFEISEINPKFKGKLQQELTLKQTNTFELPFKYTVMFWWFSFELGLLCCLMYRILMKLDKLVG